MKAIENFIFEATNEFGGGATVTEDQVRSVVKKVGRCGFGLGQIKQSKLFQNGNFVLPTAVFFAPIVFITNSYVINACCI